MARGRPRRRSQLRRKPPTREPYDRVLIVCEDAKTEAAYFRELMDHHRLSTANIEGVVGRGLDPRFLVKQAKELHASRAEVARLQRGLLRLRPRRTCPLGGCVSRNASRRATLARSLQRADAIAALGNPHISTPALDSLVLDGVALRNAYCQPVCSPSRAGFMTGRCRSNSIRATANRWAGAAPLVSKLLSDGGYDCHLVGKLHLSRAEGRVEARLQRLARRPRRTAGRYRRSRQPAAGTAPQHAGVTKR